MLLLAQLAQLVVAKQYSYDQLCVPFRCVNPVFPATRVLGEDFLGQQEERTWSCVTEPNADLYLGFCKGVVKYDFAVPVAQGAEKELGPLVRQEDDKALKAYFQHLSGLRMDAFDYREPRDDPCAESVWELVCYAHFPKCNALQGDKFLRPCATGCQNYVAQCGVECCDESVTCSWDEEITRADGSKAVESGFVAHAPPSTLCTGMITGAAGRGSALLAALLASTLSPRPALAAALFLGAVSVQGCDARPDWFPYVPSKRGSITSMDPNSVEKAMGLHSVGAWRQLPDFSITDSFKKQDGTLVYDSCSDHMIDTLHVCSGNGKCEAWDDNDVSTPLAFCRCKDAWAGPECRQRRASQATAFAFCVFGGFLGLDHFYLGFYYTGTLKLLSGGGLGVWYLIDVFRIGVGPPYTRDHFRCAADLPFWAFIVSSVSLAMALGFLSFAVVFLVPHIKAKRALHGRSGTMEVLEEHKSRPNEHLAKVKHLFRPAPPRRDYGPAYKTFDDDYDEDW
jgi:hypothetical protein